MPSPDAEVLPSRSFEELRTEVGRRATRLRRRRAVARSVPVIGALALLGGVVLSGSSSVDVDTIAPADDGPATTVDVAPDPPTGSAPDGAPAPSPGTAESGDQEGGDDPGSTPAPAQLVVFSSDRAGGDELFAVPYAGGEPRQLTRGTGDAARPALSPDGRLVAYEHRSGDAIEVRIIRIDGSAVASVPVDGASTPSWSPDGERLAFRSGGAIWVADADGGDAVQLTAGGREVDFDPAWSPTGDRIAFARFRTDGTGGLLTMRPDGSDQRSLVASVAGAPAWSPDGGRLAFVDLSTTPGRLAVIDADGGGMRTITGSDAWADRPAWTLDGARLVYDRDPDGHSPPSCLIGVYDAAVVNECLPTSDGPERAELWTVAADGSDAGRLLASAGNDVQPSVGPVAS